MEKIFKKNNLLKLLGGMLFCIGIFIASSTTSYAATSETTTLYPGESYSTEVFCPNVDYYSSSNKPIIIKSTDENVARVAEGSFYMGTSLTFELKVYAVGSGNATVLVYNSKTGEVYAVVGVTVKSPKTTSVSVCKGKIIDLPVGYVGSSRNVSPKYAFGISGVEKTVHSVKRISTSSGSNFLVDNSHYLIKDNVRMSFNTLGNYYLYFYDPDENHVATYYVKVSEHNLSTSIKESANCIQKTQVEYKCSKCEYSYVESAGDYGDHTWNDYYTIDKEATCVEKGLKSIHCKNCDLKKDETIVEESGHKYESTITAPTCTEGGYTTHVCSTCQDSYISDKADATGHEEVVDKAIAATCTSTGLTEGSHCSTCNGVIIEQEELSALEHSYGTYQVTSKATPSKAGVQTATCTLCNTAKITKSIPAVSTVKLSKTAYAYNGKKRTPSIIIKDEDGNILVNKKDYTLSGWKCETGSSATARKAIGKYSITVKFKGNYSGTKKLSFTIGPKNPKKVKVILVSYNNTKLSWSKVSGATGYKVYWQWDPNRAFEYCFSTKNTECYFGIEDDMKNTFKVVPYKKVKGVNCNSAGKTCSVYALKKVSGVKVEKFGTRAKVTWTNISGETGYQISQSTKKNATNIVATYKTTLGKSKTISAKKGKTYYYKVRAYKVVNGKKIYAPWSNVVKYRR